MRLHYTNNINPVCGVDDTGKTVVFLTDDIGKATCKKCLRSFTGRRAAMLAPKQAQNQKGENTINFEKNQDAAKNDELEFAANFVEVEKNAKKVAGGGGG